MVAASDFNPLGAAREIAKIRHILHLQKAGSVASGAGSACVGAGSAAAGASAAAVAASAEVTRETALMVGKTLNKLLNNKIAGPLAMRFLRNNPDTCVTLLDLLMQPILPVVSEAIGKALIGMVEVEPGEDAPASGYYQLVSFFPPKFARVNPEAPLSAKKMFAMPTGLPSMGKRPQRLPSFRRSKAGASSDTVGAGSSYDDDEAAPTSLESIDETAEPATAKAGGVTPRGKEGEKAAPKAAEPPKEGLVKVVFIRRLNVEHSDLKPAKVVPVRFYFRLVLETSCIVNAPHPA